MQIVLLRMGIAFIIVMFILGRPGRGGWIGRAVARENSGLRKASPECTQRAG